MGLYYGLTAFGMPKLSLHKLRHTCASILIDRGWNIKKIQYWLGHNDIKTTLDVYSHYIRFRENKNSNDIDQFASKVSGYFS